MPKRLEPQEPMGCPKWFMTYSDVITLLMTFFILLLTFATDEPEKFERMQISLFGGGGGTGVAGEPSDDADTDSVLLRKRPASGRMTKRGTEMAPLYSDPTLDSVAEGLEALEDPKLEAFGDRYEVRVPLAVLIDSKGDLTNQGSMRLDLFRRQMLQLPYNLIVKAENKPGIPKVMKMAQQLVLSGVIPGRISVGTDSSLDGDVSFTLYQIEGSNGAQEKSN